LHQRLTVLEPDLAAFYFVALANCLNAQTGDAELVAALYDLDLGLDGRSDPQASVLHLARRLEGLAPEIAHTYSVHWASILGLADRAPEELAVLELTFGIGGEDYYDREKLARALAAGNGIDEARWKMAVPLLAASLIQSSRQTESAALTEALIGIDEAASTAEILARIEAAAPDDRDVAFWFLMLSTVWLADHGRGGEAAALLEADLGVSAGDYRDPGLLAPKLRARTERFFPQSVIYYLYVLLGLLGTEERFADALALLGADLGYEFFDPLEAAGLSSRIQARYQRLPRNVPGSYLSLLCLIFAASGLAHYAVAALEIDADLTVLAWDDPVMLGAALNERLRGFDGSTRISYLAMLTWALTDAGQDQRAALLVDVALRGGCCSFSKDTRHPHMYAYLAEEWLRWWGRSANHQPLEVCAGLLPTLRELLATHGVALQDREAFVRSTSDLRRRLIQTGIYWSAREMDAARAGELRRTVLLWDLELSQRLILESFRLTEILPVAAAEPPEPGVWPLPEQPFAAEGYLPRWEEGQAVAGVI
jgi:hypothetical protein